MGAKVILKLGRMSMNMEEATIAKWHRAPGESFCKGEPLYDIETEKVTMEVEAPCDGVLIEVLVATQQDAEVGQAVCRIEMHP